MGGALVGYSESFRTSDGNEFIIEGDEYDTAYFDKGPKFRHYRAQTALITSLEFDHADIFDSVEDVRGGVWTSDRIYCCAWTPGCLKIGTRALKLIEALGFSGKVTTYSATDSNADYWAEDIRVGPTGTTFLLHVRNESSKEVTVALWGEHSVENALGLFAALEARGLERQAIAEAMASFPGVKKRLEVIGEIDNIVVVEDFGHHPTAVELTVESCRGLFPGKALWAVFEPRSATSRRNIFEEAYFSALSKADAAGVSSHPRLGEVPEDERFNPSGLIARLKETGMRAVFGETVDDLHDGLVEALAPGDVVLLFSNGDFSGLSHRLLSTLRERGRALNKSFRAFAEEIAREAGQLLLRYQRDGVEVESKSNEIDLVTSADRASEALLIDRIQPFLPIRSLQKKMAVLATNFRSVG